MKIFLKKMSHLLSDEMYIALKYKLILGRWPNLKNPNTFNEKLQWIKLHDKKTEYTKMVDKYEVKEYIAGKIGSEYLIPTLGVWDRFEDIDFEQLPEKFVLKCTHNSGGLVICKDKSKLHIKTAETRINNSLKENYFWHSREWPYKNVVPRIIAEKYMENPDGSELRDYKIQCFNGVADNILVCVDRYTERGVKYYYFDKEWNYLPYCVYEGVTAQNVDIDPPENLDKMIELAEILSKGIPELRVDLYEIGGKIYFGELTFFSSSGFDKSITKEADRMLGEKLILPITK